MAKYKRGQLLQNKYRTSVKLRVLQSNGYGKYKVKNVGGARFFYTHADLLYCLSHKSEGNIHTNSFRDFYIVRELITCRKVISALTQA